MRSTLLIGCLLWAVVYVHALTKVDRPISIKKRAASPQIYQGAQSNNWNQTQQFQWVKVNNQWVRKDGTNKLPGYSQPNVPYNQAGNQWNTPTPSRSSSPAQPSGSNIGNPSKPSQQQPGHVTPQRQDSTSSQGSIGWNPDADRALTADIDVKKTTPTPRPGSPTTATTRAPQIQSPTQRPQGPAPTPVRAPFGSGMGGQQKPQNGRYNPDASLTYDGLPAPRNPNSNKAPVKPNPNPTGSNPWGNL